MINPTEKIYDFNQEVGGKALLFNGGSLGEMEESDKNLQRHDEYQDDMDAMLELNSYNKYAKLGNTGSFCVEVYHRNERRKLFDAPYTFLVDIDLCGHHQHVFVERFSLLLQLLKELAPISHIEDTIKLEQ